MNKKQLITISLSALFAASAMGAEIPAIPSDIVWDGTTNVKIESGTQKADVYGGKIYTVLGKTDGTGPSIGTIFKGYKFRGASLQMNKDDAHVYIYGGTFYDKVAAVDNYTLKTLLYSEEKGKNTATGHMYIYGGKFNSDVSGLSTTSSGTYTANTDIRILGKMKDILGVGNMGTRGMGVYGGASGNSSGCANLVGNTSVTVENGGETSFIVGGNRMAADLTGNVTLSVENGGTVNGVVGGNFIQDSVNKSSSVNGNINISISGDVTPAKLDVAGIGGILGGGANTNVTGTTNITINSTASVTGGIAGGSAGHTEGVRVENSVISINGGTITANGSQKYVGIVEVSNAIVGGNIALGVQQTASYTMGVSKISISGGTITGDIYGGGIAQGNSYAASSTVETANITIDATNAISISGNIYGGGRADTANSTATVGTANIVFTGNGNNLTFTGTVDGNGSGAGTSATGESTFTFDGYSGAFSGTIQNFDTLDVKGNSNITGEVKVSNIGIIYVAQDSTVQFVGDNLKYGNLVESNQTLEAYGSIGSGSEVSSVKLTENASVTVKASESSVTLTSSAEGVVVNKAEEIATSNVEISVEGIVVEEVLAAWSFDISNNNEDVTVTMDVGEGVDVNTIKIFHRENETSAWEDYTEVVKDIKLENGKLTFTTTSFSDYTAAVAAPEPSAFGLLAGLGAIVLAVSRRRRNCR